MKHKKGKVLISLYHSICKSHFIIWGLSILTVLITSLLLMTPAITLSDDVYCGKEEHEHVESCYGEVLICENMDEEHEHLKGCYEEQNICGIDEHVHDSYCYKEKKQWLCEMEEHTHNEKCGEECDLLEHVHDENCLFHGESVLVCDKEHTHDEDCYTTLKPVVKEDNISNSTAVVANTTYEYYAATSLADLNGKSFVIVNLQNHPAFLSATPTVKSYDKNYNFLVGTRITTKNNNNNFQDSNVELYTFTRRNNGTFYIQAMNGQYLNFVDVSGERAGITLSDTPQELTVTLRNTHSKQGITIRSSDGHYVDWYGQNGDSDQQIFGGWKTNNPGENQSLVLYRVFELEPGIYFDINTNALNHDTQDWVDNKIPTIDYDELPFTPGSSGTLPVVKNLHEDGRVKTRTTQAISWDNISVQGIQTLLKNMDKPFGKEYEIRGWEVDVNGTKYMFEQNAPFTVDADGMLHITDITGVERVFDQEAVTFTLRYKEMCDVVLMFVNYTGTILDTEDDVAGRNMKDFTGVVVIGHIYNGKLTVGHNETFKMSTDAEIKSYFRHEYDPNDDSTQIVVSHLAMVQNENVTFIERAGSNPTEVEASVLNYIKDNKETIKLSSKDDEDERPSLDPAYADTDHYSILWYVCKEQGDYWHIDGVLVAKTTEINVVKSFTGLSDEQVKNIFDSGYGIEVFIGKGTTTNTLGQRYLTLGPQSVPGQYEYFGYDEATNTARWSLRALRDEQYAVQEIHHDIAGYSCSTGIVVQSQSAYDIDFGSYSVKGLTGGETISVSFNNFYSKDQTGILPVIKRDGNQPLDTQHGATLAGAVFELRDLNGNVVMTKTTTDQGLAYFSELKAGTYKLVETKAPEGFKTPTFEATVFVEEINGGIRITVSENDIKDETDLVVFDTTGSVQKFGIQQFYYVNNEPYPNTITVTKTFRGMTTAKLQEWAAKNATLPEDQRYYITVRNNSTLEERKLSLDNVSNVIQASNMYTWRLSGLGYGLFTIEEHNYQNENYTDTIVDASVNGIASEVRFGEDTAMFDFQVFPRTTDVINIVNTYTNYFDLYLRKVDSVTGTPLPNAVFKLYGGYEESTDTSQTITYDGVKYFYISQIVSGEDGYAVQTDLNLSDNQETFVYILDEVNSPIYYQKLNEPIQIQVSKDDENYHNNVFTMNAPNVRASQSLEITKVIGGEQGEFVPDDVEYQMQLDFYNETGALDKLHQYPYTIYNSDDSVYTTGTLTFDANTFVLKKDQTIRFEEVPVLYEYVLKETNATLNGSSAITLTDPLQSTIEFNAFSQSYSVNDNALISVGAREMRGIVLADGENEVNNAVTLTNQYPREEVYTEFDVTKFWNDTTTDTKADVQIELYRKTILNGNETLELMETVTLNDSNHWTHSWDKKLVYGENGETYIYYIREIPMEDYRIDYNKPVLKDMVDEDGNQIDLVLASGGKHIEITNVREFKIPETGGMGTTSYYIGGFLLMLFAFILNKRKLKTR